MEQLFEPYYGCLRFSAKRGKFGGCDIKLRRIQDQSPQDAVISLQFVFQGAVQSKRLIFISKLQIVVTIVSLYVG